MFDEGRFGPVYRSHDPETDRPVLVRTFAQPLTPEEQNRLVDALTLLCETPLDHQAIARPLVAGIDNGRPFLVHTLLPGESLQRFLRSHGPLPYGEVVLRATQLAAALDFAAAAGVYHGDLGTRDVIAGPESTGISGFGVVQALIEAGVQHDGIHPTREGDIEALGRIAFEMLVGRPPENVEDIQSLTVPGAETTLLRVTFGAVLSREPNRRPASALEFAAALQHAAAGTAPVASTLADAPSFEESGAPEADAFGLQQASGATESPADLPLREETSEPWLDPGPELHPDEAAVSVSGGWDEARDLSEFTPELPAGIPQGRPETEAFFREPSVRPGPEAAGPGRVQAAPPIVRADAAAREADRAPRAGRSRVEPPRTIPSGESRPVAAGAPLFAAVGGADRPRRSGTRVAWFLVVAALAMGIFSGFGAGFFVGQRGEPLPLPDFPADVLRQSSSGADDTPAGTSMPAPAGPADSQPPSGSVETDDGPVIEQPDIASRDLPPSNAADASSSAAQPGALGAPAPPAANPPVSAAPPAVTTDPGTPAATPAPSENASAGDDGSAAAPAGRDPGPPSAAATRPAPPARRVPPDTPGGLHVLSRPEGADVFVDGALVGRTPLVIASVAPGSHDVRIELPGHRRWATSVRVEPGERARVAASLEQ